MKRVKACIDMHLCVCFIYFFFCDARTETEKREKRLYSNKMSLLWRILVLDFYLFIRTIESCLKNEVEAKLNNWNDCDDGDDCNYKSCLLLFFFSKYLSPG